MKQFENIFLMPFMQALVEAGGEVFIVGGCVRDAILGKDPKDIDIIVRELPFKELSSILNKFGKVDLVGESFGVIKFKTQQGEEFDIALPRTDKKIDGAKGHKSIETQSDHTMSIEADLERRDFTVNAIAVDKDGNLVDPFDGQSDLEESIIRCVSKEAFVDDPLRMLRAVQFAARFGFEIEQGTLGMIASNIDLIKEITPERVLTELQKVFEKGGSAEHLWFLLKHTNLWETYFGVPIDEDNAATAKNLSEFLFLMSALDNTADFYKDTLKIDNDTYKDLQAFDIYHSQTEEGTTDRLVTKYWKIFKGLKKSDILLKSDIIHPMIVGPFKDGSFPKKMSELAITGEEFLAMGLVGTQIGQAQEKCLKAIFLGLIPNTKEGLYKVLR